MLGWACHFSKKIDSQGNEIPIPFYDLDNESPIAPNEFAFDLRLRGESKLSVLTTSEEADYEKFH